MTTDNRGVPASFIQAEARDPAESWPGAPPNFGQEVLPHVVTIGSTTGGSAKAYNWADEALRDSRENADKMLTDCGITECLEARLRSVALLNWHIAPENENSSDEKALADQVTSYIKRTPHFAKFRWAMGLARWYGRYAVAPLYGKDWVGGKMRTICSSWEPRHGDKLVFRFDDGSHRTKAGQVGIRVGAQRQWIDTGAQDYRGNKISQIEATQHGLVYWLNDKERRLIVVNKHIIEDGPFEDPLRAGAIHGIGIRDRIYWTWYGMIECLSDILCYLERSAFGIEIWKYPAGNVQAKARAEEAAKKISSNGRTVLIVPVFQGENAEQFGVQHIEPGLGGVEQAMTIVREYFGHKIKRYILGQTLTSEADATGLGSGVADAHLATFADIIRWDALNDEETLTSDFVKWLQIWNHPDSRGINLRAVIDTDSPDAEKKMKGYEAAWGMGARIKEEDVLATIGASVPKATDRTLLNPAVANGGQQQGGFGGLGFQMPGQQPPPLPQSQQEAIRRLADVEKFINGVSLGKIMQERHTYTLRPDEAAKITAEPSDAQKASGNYRKGKTNLHGLTISIENAKGTRRKPEWPELSAHYGYINRTTGRDGDHVDVFIGPNHDSELVFVIDQQTAAGRFDEHKCILGTTSKAEALELYRANYPADWMVGPVTAMTVEQFKAWLADGDTTKPVGAQVSKYEARWVTIGGKKEGDERRGGFPVQIDGEGNILKGGPRGLQGKHVSEIGKHFEETREARAKEADDFFGNIAKEHKAAAESRAATDAPGNTRSLKKIIAYQADQWGMDEETYAQFMDEVMSDELDRLREREHVKKSMREQLGRRTGNAGHLKRIEERGGKDGRGGDHTHIVGFDEVAGDFASHYPHLFMSGDHEGDAWNLLIEGAQPVPSKISREFHDKVDQRLQEAMAAAGHNYGARSYESEYISEDFTERGRPERYTWDESKVNRDEGGQFAEKDGGDSFKLTGKPKQERTLDIKLLGKAKQRDLFGGRGDAPGQTSFFDDIDPKAKNVRDQGSDTKAKPDDSKEIAEDFDALKKKHPELARFADNPDPLPKVKGGQIAHMTDRQHAIYSDLAKAKSAGSIGQEEFNAGLAAIRMMDEPENQIAPTTKPAMSPPKPPSDEPADAPSGTKSAEDKPKEPRKPKQGDVVYRVNSGRRTVAGRSVPYSSIEAGVVTSPDWKYMKHSVGVRSHSGSNEPPRPMFSEGQNNWFHPDDPNAPKVTPEMLAEFKRGTEHTKLPEHKALHDSISQRLQSTSEKASEPPQSKVKSKIFGAMKRAKQPPEKYSARFNPDDHPRGQPGNAGQFAADKATGGGKNDDEPSPDASVNREQQRQKVLKNGHKMSRGQLSQIANAMFDDAAENLRKHDPKKADEYLRATRKVATNLSKEALRLVLSNVASVHFYATRAELLSAGRDYGVPPTAVGFFGDDNTLHLNGGSETDSRIEWTLENIYAHEVSHQIDKALPADDGSNGKDWNSAWTDELADGKLIPEAAASATEGWSEFGELAILDPELAAKLPKCYAHWKALGLIK